MKCPEMSGHLPEAISFESKTGSRKGFLTAGPSQRTFCFLANFEKDSIVATMRSDRKITYTTALLSMITTIVLLVSEFTSARSDSVRPCESSSWIIHGHLTDLIERYDKMARNLKQGQNPVGDLNAFLKTDGLPILLGTDAQITEFPNRLERKGEEPGGTISALFLKSMSLKKNSQLYLDVVYEVANTKAIKPLNKWNVPYEASPIGIEGDELFVSDAFGPICGNSPGKLVSLAIKPTGVYRAVKSKAKTNVTLIEDCPSAGAVMGGSAYSVCNELKDSKTKKKRILVLNAPMT